MVSIAAKCSNHDLVQHPDTPGNFSPPTSGPAPQEVQYYRASSVALTLDGYNNTAYFLNSTDDTPLPESVDKEFLACLNFTIGAAVPLVDTPSKKRSHKDIAWIVIGCVVGTAAGKRVRALQVVVDPIATDSHRIRLTVGLSRLKLRCTVL
jgi:hypothetical protein